jgi:hypothetical protein
MQATTSGFICLDVAVNRFMANAHLIRDLFRTPLFMQASHHYIPAFWVDLRRITGAQVTRLWADWLVYGDIL